MDADNPKSSANTRRPYSPHEIQHRKAHAHAHAHAEADKVGIGTKIIANKLSRHVGLEGHAAQPLRDCRYGGVTIESALRVARGG